jgi:hypothetical protein
MDKYKVSSMAKRSLNKKDWSWTEDSWLQNKH